MKTELELLRKEVELLRKEIELLRAERRDVVRYVPYPYPAPQPVYPHWYPWVTCDSSAGELPNSFGTITCGPRS